jgi:hypothetical protein
MEKLINLKFSKIKIIKKTKENHEFFSCLYKKFIYNHIILISNIMI